MSRNQESLHLGVLLSGTGRTLENLLSWQERGDLRGRVTAVATNRPGVRGVEIAERAGVPVAAFRLSAFEDRVARDRAMASFLREHGCDMVLLAGYLSLLDLSGFGTVPILNIHPSLLPRHGGEGCWGLHVHEAVIAAGDAESGCSVHLVDEEFDRGQVLAQRRVPVLPADDADALAARVFAAECELYPDTINRIARGDLILPQGREEKR